jgi:hypothetical protein
MGQPLQQIDGDDLDGLDLGELLPEQPGARADG